MGILKLELLSKSFCGRRKASFLLTSLVLSGLILYTHPGTFERWINSTVYALDLQDSTTKPTKNFPEETRAETPRQETVIEKQKDPELDKDKLRKALDRVASKHDRSVLLLLTDGAEEELTYNFHLTSIIPHNITNYMFLSTDMEHCSRLQLSGINCFAIANYSRSKEAHLYRSKLFIQMMNIRLETLTKCLEMGFNVLASDVDVTYLKNPFPYIKSDGNKSYNVYFLADTNTVINAGFMFIRNTSTAVGKMRAALKIVHKKSDVDDQQAINMVFPPKSSKSLTAKLPRSQFLSGQLYWETGGFQREFVQDEPPCKECVVVHNNWIVSLPAKRYRARESGMWDLDTDAYYSDSERRYLTYENLVDFSNGSLTRDVEWNALRNALAIAQILNRTLILPKFRCGPKVVKKPPHSCSLLHRTKIMLFEKEFPNYREHSFLAHAIVPESTKASLSPKYCFNVTNTIVSKELFSKSCDEVVQTSSGKSVTVKEIRDNFSNSALKVLRFGWLYRVFEKFDNSEIDKQFNAKIKNGFQVCHYRQY